MVYLWPKAVAGLDVAAGEEEGIDDVAIGGEGEAPADGGKEGGVVLLARGEAGKGRDDDLVKELVAEAAAAAMAEKDDV